MKTSGKPVVVKWPDDKIESSFKPLEPVLKKWHAVLSDYSKRSKGDQPWWYRERPQIGFLAAAAWSADGVALEEWGMKKGPQKCQSEGRNDLWLCYDGNEWFLEAKHVWCEIQKGDRNCRKLLENALSAAKSSADKVQTGPSVAAVFASLFWKPLRGRESEFASNLEQFTKTVKGLDVEVACFERPRTHEGYWKAENGGRWLGVLLLLKAVRGFNQEKTT